MKANEIEIRRGSWRPGKAQPAKGDARQSAKRNEAHFVPILKIGALAAMVACLWFAAPPAWGQVARGNIVGTVSDPSGARIPQAEVTVKQTQTGLTRSLTTSNSGDFSASLLPIGDYSVTVGHPGFESNVTKEILLTVDQTVNLTIVLQTGRVTQSVTVNAKPALLEQTTSSLGQLVGHTYMQDLPLNGRNPYGLELLSGNVTPTTGSGINQPVVAGGARYTANDFLVDGVTNTNYQHSIEYFPSVDAVQEYKVQTSTYSAEFGNSAGLVVNLVTKSGTNQFHGSAYDYIRNEKLDANDFFSNAAGKPIAPYKRNQFGFTLGGPLGLHPLSANHSTFFFFSYEGLRQRQAAFGGIANVAPVAFRQGDFSGLKDSKGNLIPIYDPSTRAPGPNGVVTATAFQGNIIPSQDLNSVAKSIMDLIPTPNFGAANAQARNYTRTAPTPSDSGNYDARIDHNFSSANTAYLRFSGQNGWSTSNGILPPPLAGSQNINRPRDASLNYVHIFSPTIVNSAQFSATRLNSSSVGASQNAVVPGLAKWPFPVQGLPGIWVNATGARSGSNEFDNIGDAGSTINIENGFEWTDNLTIVKGKHTLKSGADFLRTRLDFIGGGDFFGNMYFGPTYTSNPSVPGSGAPFADFVLGLPSGVDGSQYLNWVRFRQAYGGGYIQDDWKATSRLTLNLGLRYDVWTVPVDARNLGGMLDVKTGHIALPGNGGYSRGLINGDHNNLAPRFGFAYRLKPTMVVRGGYGLFYAQQEKNASSGVMGVNPPNTPLLTFPTVSAATTVTPPATISTPIASVPFNTSLSNFSVTNPWAITLFTSNFTNNPAQYVQQFNLTYEYQPKPDWLFELSYSGSFGRKLGSRFNLNQEPYQDVLNGTNTQAHRFAPYLNGVLVYDGAYGTSNYSALNLKMQKNFSHGLQFLMNYTYARYFELGPPGVVATWTQAGGTSLPLDSFDMGREYGPAVTDLPHYFVTSFVYNLPFGPGQRLLNIHGPVGKVVGGWQFNGIATRHSGFPSDLRYGPHVANFSTINVPNRVPDQNLQVANPSVNQWFNPEAFAPASTALASNGTQQVLFGNLAQRAGRGPGGFDLDFSLFKNIPITERVRMQFRAEAFNITNTPTFVLPSASSPNLTYGSTVFGQLSSASAVGRQIQLAVRLDF